MRLTEAAKGVAIGQLGFSALSFQAGSDERRVDGSGRNRNDSNAVACVFDTPLPSLQQVSGFDGTIRGNPPSRTMSLPAGHIHDDSGLLFLHHSQSVFCQQRVAREIDSYHSFPQFRRHFIDGNIGLHRLDNSIVDQNVETSVSRHGLFHDLPTIVFGAYVSLNIFHSFGLRSIIGGGSDV